MFKKWISCAVALMVLMLCLMSVTVSAGPDDTIKFSLSVTEGGVGDTVQVSISVPENSRFTNATMYLHYNPEAVSYVNESIAAGSASPKSGTMFEALDHRDKSYVKFAYITGNVVTKGGVLLTFDFEVLSAIPAAFSLSFDECQGEAEGGAMFDLKYEVVGCVLNNDGSVSDPTGEAVHTTTSVTASETTTVTSTTPETTIPANDEYYEDLSQSTTTPVNTTATTMPTMIVTDANSSVVEIPVATSTDAAGNVVTIPVAVVTDVKGTTVTVPVVVVTDAQGNVATIPVAEGTDVNGNNVTIPVAIVTDAEGNVQTVPVATATDANGSIVTVPDTTSATQPTQGTDPAEPATDNSGLTTTIIVVVIGAAVAAVVGLAATKIRKKNAE